jgi:hypothetical protein
LFVDLVERRTSREDDHLEPSSVKVSINPVFFERIEREVRRFEDGRFVRTREPSRQLFGTVFSGSKEDEFLPASKFGRDCLDDTRRR